MLPNFGYGRQIMPTDVKKQGLSQMSANRPNIGSTGNIGALVRKKGNKFSKSPPFLLELAPEKWRSKAWYPQRSQLWDWKLATWGCNKVVASRKLTWSAFHCKLDYQREDPYYPIFLVSLISIDSLRMKCKMCHICHRCSPYTQFAFSLKLPPVNPMIHHLAMKLAILIDFGAIPPSSNNVSVLTIHRIVHPIIHPIFLIPSNISNRSLTYRVLDHH